MEAATGNASPLTLRRTLSSCNAWTKEIRADICVGMCSIRTPQSHLILLLWSMQNPRAYVLNPADKVRSQEFLVSKTKVRSYSAHRLSVLSV
jgi:hypothetical protein